MSESGLNVISLLPHKPPMLLVDELVSFSDASARVRAHIGPEHLFLDENGILDNAALVEMVAQSYAAWAAALHAREHGSEPQEGGGYLVSVRGFEFLLSARQGDALETEVSLSDDFMGTHIVNGTVWRGREKLAKGQVYIFTWEGQLPPEAA